MGRTSKKTETNNVGIQTEVDAQEEQKLQQSGEIEQTTESPKENLSENVEISSRIVEIMRLYPQYEQLWITPHGFVHPLGASEKLLKDATLYKNKFFNK